MRHLSLDAMRDRLATPAGWDSDQITIPEISSADQLLRLHGAQYKVKLPDLARILRDAGTTPVEIIKRTVASLSDRDLEHWAARDALATLAANWEAAMHDGMPMADLLGDVEKTIAVLSNTAEVLRALTVEAGDA